MEVKRVKIHSEEWLNENCEKIKIGGITHYRNDAGRIYLHSNMGYIFGNIIDIVIYSDKSMCAIDDNEWIIEDWMIEEYVDGCMHCNGGFQINKSNYELTVTISDNSLHIIGLGSIVEIKYCPMCGKKLSNGN